LIDRAFAASRRFHQHAAGAKARSEAQ
jgi:hypothetical protein